MLFVLVFNAIARRAFKAYFDFDPSLPEESVKPTSIRPKKKNRGQVRRALVLAGGGGKGAYQVGCLKAFQEEGIDFSLVLGSYIGALNGAFFLAHGVDTLIRLWTSTITNVFSWKTYCK